MQTIIIPDGGASGAILLTKTGAVPIKLSEGVLKALSATSRLSHATECEETERHRSHLAKMAVGSANLAVEMLEAAFGPLDTERAVVFLQDGDGFTCGSTGKPPVPLPWPARAIDSSEELIRSHVVAPEIIDLVRAAKAHGSDLGLLIDSPETLASELGVQLSDKAKADLALLSPAAVEKMTDPAEREAMALFRAVLKDGRYTETWFERPYEIARELNVPISEAALQRIVSVPIVADCFGSYIAAGVVWAGVCIAVGTLFVGQMNPIDSLIEDHSGIDKF